jgi:hypothetical protein
MTPEMLSRAGPLRAHACPKSGFNTHLTSGRNEFSILKAVVGRDMIPEDESKSWSRSVKKKKIRYRKIHDLVVEVIEPSIDVIKRVRKRRSMPYKDIEKILKVFFPKTRHNPPAKGFYKHVFIVHSDKKKLVLKIGRSNKHIRKDYATYNSIPANVRNRYFAKIYWRYNLFMLQKYGEKAAVPDSVEAELKKIGEKYHLKDVRKANIMKFGKSFKIVDAERR